MMKIDYFFFNEAKYSIKSTNSSSFIVKCKRLIASFHIINTFLRSQP